MNDHIGTCWACGKSDKVIVYKGMCLKCAKGMVKK